MAWREWFDFPFIRHVFQHVSGTIVTVLLFAITAWLVSTVVPSGPTRAKVEQVEGLVLLGLVIILAIQLFISLIKEVMKQAKGGWNGTQVLAF
jgi:hypothetical protein